MGGLPWYAFASLFFRPKRERGFKERKKERKKKKKKKKKKMKKKKKKKKKKKTATTTKKKKKKNKNKKKKKKKKKNGKRKEKGKCVVKECVDNVHNPQLLKRKKIRRGIEPRSFCLTE